MTSQTIDNTPELRKELSGFVLLDKPAGVTSFQALFPVKKIFGTRRVGHAGTLDQEASGLIVAAVGKCTRLLHYIETQDKAYRFKLHLGRSTDSLEWSGNILAEDPQGGRTSNAVEIAIRRFIGEMEQIPPVFSAIKIDGLRASDRARKGQDVEMKARKVTIHDLELAEYGCFISPEPRREFQLACRCSKGTYIRSLARDLAADLGTLGCTSAIRRTAIGDINVERATAPAELQLEHLLKPSQLLPWPVLSVGKTDLERLLQGNSIACDPSAGTAMAFVSDSAGGIRLAAEMAEGRLSPKFHLE